MIANTVFEKALSNKDNIKIMKAACRKFHRLLSTDEQYNCSLYGLWKALLLDNTKLKFTTVLFTNVKWACLDYINKNRTKDSRPTTNYIDVPMEYSNGLYEYVDGLPPELAKVLTQRYESNMTLNEIGSANGYSHETARQYIQRAIEILRKKCL